MDYLFILYILVTLGIGLGGTVVMIKSDKTTGGLLFLIGAIIIFVYYGIRWFSGDSLNIGLTKSSTWPPSINLCPDFLTLYKVGTENICVDLDGVSYKVGGIQKLTDPSLLSSTNKENYMFHLFENQTGSTRLTSICNQCKTKQVTWEGIFDGASCLNPSAIPLSTGGSTPTAAANPAACPS